MLFVFSQFLPFCSYLTFEKMAKNIYFKYITKISEGSELYAHYIIYPKLSKNKCKFYLHYN